MVDSTVNVIKAKFHGCSCNFKNKMKKGKAKKDEGYRSNFTGLDVNFT